MGVKRFDIYFVSGIGLGIFWDNYCYQFHIVLQFPLFAIAIGIGKRK